MREDCFLDFDRSDVLAARDDDVLLAIDDQEVAFFVDDRHVAGVKPSAAHHVGRIFGLLPVAVHDVVGAHDDFADALSIVRDRFVVRVKDVDLDAGHRVARHRLPPPSVFVGQAFEMVLDERLSQHRRRLSQPISAVARQPSSARPGESDRSARPRRRSRRSPDSTDRIP